jgi:predicted nucleotidyltransferase
MSSKNKHRRHTRAAVQRILDGVLARCAEVQADPTEGMQVEKLAVFGSFLDDGRPDYGDLDLAIKVGVKPGFVWLDVLDEAINAGYCPWNPRTAHLDPHGRVKRRVKARSQIISLHDFDELAQLKCPFRVVWEAPA